MTEKNHRRIAACTALGTLTLAGLFTWNLARTTGLLDHRWYLIHAAAGVLVFSAWIASSHVLHLLRRPWLSRALLIAGTVGLVLSVMDLVVLGALRDTTASAIPLCLTHQLWEEDVLDIDAHGFWEDDLEACLSEDGCPRPIVAVIGDSFTLGQGVGDEAARFTDQLQRLLSAREGIPGTVLNFGVEGAETYDELTKTLPQVARVKPDIIVIAYLTNDIGHHDHTVWRSDPLVAYPPVSDLIRTSPTLNFLYYRLYGAYSSRSVGPGFYHRLIQAYRSPLLLQHHRQEIAALIRESRAITDHVVFAVLPFPTMWNGAEEIRDRIHAALTGTAERQGAEALSLAHIADEHTLRWFAVSPIDPHPSEAAHLAIAEALLPTVARQIRQRHGSVHAFAAPSGR
jgi:lysophospholipase L1-like esterase